MGRKRQLRHKPGGTTDRGYGIDYQRARARLLSTPQRCVWCGSPATTADHYPPLIHGGTHDDLVPSCRRCNYGRVAERAWQRARRYPPRRAW